MVLNLSDQDSTHQSPNEGSSDNASMPSPEARLGIDRSPVQHTPYPERENGVQYDRSQDEANATENHLDAPIDFSVRRPEGERVKRENNSINTSERRSPNRLDTRDSFHRSPISPQHLSPERNSYRSEEKIGEPKLAFPGLPPGMPLPPFPGQLPPGFPLHMMAHFNMVNNLPACNEPKGLNNGQNDKNNARPFKAYPKDPLSLPLGYFGLPGIPPLPGIDMATAQAFSHVNSEEMFKHYRDFVIKRAEQERQEKRKSPVRQNGIDLLEPISPASPTKNSQISPNAPVPLLSMNQPQWPQSQPSPPSRAPQPSVITANSLTSDVNLSLTPSQESLTPKSPNSSLPTRKRNRSNSDGTVVKDSAYWERRRKNNEAAKRSRDSRRAKEDEIAIRAAFLEQENLKLRVEVTALKNETAKLRCMLYNS